MFCQLTANQGEHLVLEITTPHHTSTSIHSIYFIITDKAACSMISVIFSLENFQYSSLPPVDRPAMGSAAPPAPPHPLPPSLPHSVLSRVTLNWPSTHSTPTTALMTELYQEVLHSENFPGTQRISLQSSWNWQERNWAKSICVKSSTMPWRPNDHHWTVILWHFCLDKSEN